MVTDQKSKRPVNIGPLHDNVGKGRGSRWKLGEQERAKTTSMAQRKSRRQPVAPSAQRLVRGRDEAQLKLTSGS